MQQVDVLQRYVLISLGAGINMVRVALAGCCVIEFSSPQYDVLTPTGETLGKVRSSSSSSSSSRRRRRNLVFRVGLV